MVSNVKRKSLTLATLWLLSGFTFAQELQILAVEEPPSSFENRHRNPAGFAVDIVREIQQRVKNTTPISIVPEARALLLASKQPNVLMFGFSRTPQREDQFHWISLLSRKSWVLFASQEGHIKIENLQDALGIASIGAVRGDVRELFLRREGFHNIVPTVDHEQSLKMLAAGRFQLLFYEPLGLAYTAKKLGIPIHSFKPVFEVRKSDVYLVMTKNGTSLALVNAWRQAAEAIKSDGTFEQVSKQWSERINLETGLEYGYYNGALDTQKNWSSR